MDCDTGTPACRAAPMAASAFSALCAPNNDHLTVPTGLPPSSTTNLEKSPPSSTSSDHGASGARRSRKAFERRPRAHGERGLQVLVAGVPENASRARDRAHQVMKLFLDRRQVFVDVGVIELEIVEDQRARAVVDELGALVEERGVVFIGFDDEELAPAEARADRKISGHAADEEPGIEPGVFEDPRQHARGGGLAMRACDAEHVHVAQHFARQPFRSRRCRECRSRAAPR